VPAAAAEPTTAAFAGSFSAVRAAHSPPQSESRIPARAETEAPRPAQGDGDGAPGLLRLTSAWTDGPPRQRDSGPAAAAADAPSPAAAGGSSQPASSWLHCTPSPPGAGAVQAPWPENGTARHADPRPGSPRLLPAAPDQGLTPPIAAAAAPGPAALVPGPVAVAGPTAAAGDARGPDCGRI
jgi:hypothetical protein